MGFRYRKSINLGGGVRLNLSKKGVGLSMGIKGFRVSSGPRGHRVTVSIPGTGLSYTETVGRTGSGSYDAPPHLLDVAPASETHAVPAVLYCLNCHSPMIVGQNHCDNCGRCIVQSVPRVGYSIGQFRLLIVSIVATFLLAVFAVLFVCSHWVEHQRLEAIRLEQERQLHLTNVMTTLQAADPKRGYALCSTDGTVIPFNLTFKQACVRTVMLSQSNNVVTASVGLLGIKQENQAPTIYVTLYDENGNMLSRSPIVKFTFSVLENGETREVEDKMELPNGGSPAIVSVDDSP
jgi:hypothetical protein